MKLFDHLNRLTFSKEPLDPTDHEQTKTYDQYMLNRFLSMNEMYIPIVEPMNVAGIPDETHDLYYRTVLPKKKQFNKYIKKKADANLEDKQLLCDYFECGLKEVENHLRILSEDQLNQILSVYKRN